MSGTELNMDTVTDTDRTAEDQAAADKYDKAQEGKAAPVDPAIAEQEKANRPEWLPEKFKTVEDFTKAYGELEKKLGAPKDGDKPAEGETSETTSEEIPADAEKALEGTGFNYADLQAEFMDNEGKLSTETIEKLGKAGISQEMIDGHVAGMQALADKQVSESLQVIGGKDNFQAMSEWAVQNTSVAEREAFNKATKGSVAEAQLALQGMWAKYRQAGGTVEPAKRVTGETGGTASRGGYASNAEMVKAMSHKDYGKSPEYTAEVERRVGLMK